ncbi:MAG: helix-turn-helix domain-containing protein [Alphaproteobacteria bacterium]|nr:helix-turn-helix domain-containing protein [Alphaproteobacteria bacterium]
MREGPDISIVAALIGNPACANMLTALLSGPALTATELGQEAGLTPSTVSGYLARLQAAGLIAIERQGRHRYFRLANPDVAVALEGLMPLAARAGHLRIRTGPRDPELRRARTCYDHLAGDLAVTMFDRFVERRLFARRDGKLSVTVEGRRFFVKAGIDLDELERGRRQLCQPCLDWSERRSHLGGALGAAVLEHICARGWAARESKTRIVRLSAAGEQKLGAWFSK